MKLVLDLGNVQYKAKTFHSKYIENFGEGRFKLHKLHALAQFSPINNFIKEDINGDGQMDIFLAGNMYGTEIETVRGDVGLGLSLLGDGNGSFTPVELHASGLFSSLQCKTISKN